MKAVGIFLLIYMGCMLSWRSAAGQLNDQFNKNLIKLKTAEEIQRIEKLFNETQISRRACRIELREGWVPSSCFQALENERRFGLHTNHSFEKTRLRLDQICRAASAGLRIARSPNLKSLTSPCRRSVLKALKIRAYRESKAWSGT